MPVVPRHPDVRIEVGIFGGSGFYRFLDDAVAVPVQTPYGEPSAPVMVGTVEGRRVGFLPRHGIDHTVPPHRVNYRANAWAMRHLGAGAMVLPCAAGSLQRHVAPGSFVIADQIVDRTWGRPDTFLDGPEVEHLSFADPYDAGLRAIAVQTAGELAIPVHDGGTVVVVNGPRFSTRAESRWYTAMGWEVINMTAYPEVVLCRELGMAPLNISLITDHDAGLQEDPEVEPVTHQAVLAAFEANLDALRRLLFAIIPKVPTAG